MPELSELSDWVWYAVVLLWVAAKVLPRIFGGRADRGSDGRSQAPARPKAGPATRQGRPRISGTQAPETRPDAEAQKGLRSATPIEPR